MDHVERLPKGQYLTKKWPVLHEGTVPDVNLDTWDFRVFGSVEKEVTYTWKEFLSLDQEEFISDIHCVTTWSRYDNKWRGIPFKDVFQAVNPSLQSKYVMIHSEQGFTTNLPLEELLKPNVMFAFEHDGEPLAPEHGYPLRLVVPHLYFWKSAKWVRGIEFLLEDAPGFWEERGYHMLGDPWVIDENNTDGQRFRDDPTWFGDESKEANEKWRADIALARKKKGD